MSSFLIFEEVAWEKVPIFVLVLSETMFQTILKFALKKEFPIPK